MIKTGESFDCVFRLKFGVMPKEFEIGNMMSLMISMGD